MPGKDTRLNAMQSCGVAFHLQSGHAVAQSKHHKMLAQDTEAPHTHTHTHNWSLCLPTTGLGAMTSKKIFLEWRTQVPPPAWHQIVLAAWLKFLPTPTSHQNTSYFGRLECYKRQIPLLDRGLKKKKEEEEGTRSILSHLLSVPLPPSEEIVRVWRSWLQ